ncbi:MAG: Immunity protein 8 [Verrucomicrobiota bacterium]
MWGKSLLIVQIFSWNDVEEAIEEFLAEISTESWEDAVKILTRYMDWEYEGM